MGLRHFVGQHRMPVMGIGGALVVFAGAMASFSLLNKPRQAKPAPVVVAHKAPEVYYSPLTGLKVADQAATTKPVTAVMLENSPSARPQSGVKQAEVVYEAIAEAGITRFLALYQQNKPTMIGPVRSLRPYYIDWLAPYQPSVAPSSQSGSCASSMANASGNPISPCHSMVMVCGRIISTISSKVHRCGSRMVFNQDLRIGGIFSLA